MKDWIIYQLVRFVSGLLGLLPLRWALALARGMGNIFYSVMSGRRNTALANVRQALGDLPEKERKKIVRASFQNVCLSVVELFRVDTFCRNAEKFFTLQGREHTENALAKGKGFILVCSHVGSWELLAMTPFLTGQTWSVVVKQIRNPYLNRRVDSLRRRMTLIPIPKQGAAREIFQRLKKNECVSILIDQWAGPEGIWGDFMGRETSTTSLPARIAHKTGCVLLPAFCFREKNGRYTLQIEPPFPVDSEHPDWETQTTLKLNRLLEEKIRSRPEQWVWTHKRWKAKPVILRKTALPGSA